MNRTSVRSSDIASIGYDEEAEILEIEYISGGTYQYSGVPVNIYNGVMSAPSHGIYAAQHIKHKYPFSKQ